MSDKEKKHKKKRSIPRKIINGFILLFGVVIVLLVLFLGFSQTSTFRGYLKDEVISQFDSSTNGRLSIGEIDGTLLTSLFLKDVEVEVDSQKLFSTGLVEVKVSPLQLFVKKIYFRKIGISNAEINLLQDKNGRWSSEKLLPQKEIPDTTEKKGESEFPFLIQANNINISNLNFTRKSYPNLKSQRNYETLNLEDFRINNFNLKAKFIADINNLRFDLIIDRITAQTNLSNFNLNKLSGRILLNKKSAAVENLSLVTGDSNIDLNAELKGFNLKDSVVLGSLEELPLQIDLKTEPFVLSNLATFIPAVDFIKGAPNLTLRGNGTFGNINIEKLNLQLGETNLNLTGSLKNLHEPANLFIDSEIKNSTLYYSDIRELLPNLELQNYDDLHLRNLNINFEGKPQNFTIKLKGKYNEGSIDLDSKLNFADEVMSYDVKYKFAKLDLSPILNSPTKINSQGTVKGKGVKPQNLQTNINITANNSFFSNYNINDLTFRADAKSKRINLDFNGTVNKADTKLSGMFDFTDEDTPKYDFDGRIDSLHLTNFIKDSTLVSTLNFNFDAKGESFDLDSIKAKFDFGVYNSVYKGYNIDSSNMTLNLERSPKRRRINFTSDFIDLNFQGDFSLDRAVDILSYEASTISKIISDKLNELNPLNVISDSVKTASQIEVPEFATKDLAIDYSFKFKDFDFIAVLLDKEQIDIGGSGTGRIENNAENFSINTNLNVDYILSAGEDDLFYISNLNTNLNFSRDNRSVSFDKLFGALSINGDRVFAGANIEQIQSDIIFNQSRIFFNASVVVDKDLKLATDGNLSMSSERQQITLSNLNLDYKNVDWSNRNPIEMSYDLDSLMLKDFVLHNDSARISLNGYLLNNGRQNIDLAVNKLPLKVLNRYLSDKSTNLNASVNLNTKINGTFIDPVINSNLNVIDLSLGTRNFGSLLGSLNYSEQSLITDIKFVKDTADIRKPKFALTGNLPINLSFASVSERLPGDRSVDVSFRSDNFNLQSLGSIFPFIKNQKGELLANVKVTGGFNNLKYDGYLGIRNGFLTVRPTNLDYNFGLKVNLDENKFSVDSLVVQNTKDAKFPGTLWGGGYVSLSNNSIEDAELSIEGNLSVLGPESKSTNEYVYGDLYLGSKGKWNFVYEDGEPRFEGNIELKRTNMVFVADQSTYSASAKDFVYRFVEDTSKAKTAEAKFQKLLSDNNDKQTTETNGSNDNGFEYDVSVTTRNDIRVDILLSRATNQKLMIEARGDLRFANTDGELNAQGSLELLEGSKLEFFKTLDATGTIRFESDLTDPYLNITATYRGNYAVGEEDQEVAVKIRLNGPVRDLGKNLANNPENFLVYVGSDNIDNNVPDRSKDMSDAITFILVGKFKEDLTRQDKERTAGMLEGATNSLVGSVLTSYLNSTVGDLITSVSIGETRLGDTRVSLTGRAGNFRYRLGGTQAALQDFARANLLIQYFFSRHFLIKAERKEPVGQTFGTDDKITEIGLKYKFEF